MIERSFFSCFCGSDNVKFLLRNLPDCYNIDKVREYLKICLDEIHENFIIISPNISIAVICSSKDLSDNYQCFLKWKLLSNFRADRRWVEIHMPGDKIITSEDKRNPIKDSK